MIAGSEGWDEIEDFGEAKLDFLGSYDNFDSGASSAANGVILGQVKTEQKSNEITVIPELLKLLNLHGCLVSIDAMGYQKK